MLGRIAVLVLAGTVGFSSGCGVSRTAAETFPRLPGVTFKDSPVEFGPSTQIDKKDGAADTEHAYGVE